MKTDKNYNAFKIVQDVIQMQKFLFRGTHTSLYAKMRQEGCYYGYISDEDHAPITLAFPKATDAIRMAMEIAPKGNKTKPLLLAINAINYIQCAYPKERFDPRQKIQPSPNTDKIEIRNKISLSDVIAINSEEKFFRYLELTNQKNDKNSKTFKDFFRHFC